MERRSFAIRRSRLTTSALLLLPGGCSSYTPREKRMLTSLTPEHMIQMFRITVTFSVLDSCVWKRDPELHGEPRTELIQRG